MVNFISEEQNAVSYFENYDLQNIVTPVDSDQLKYLLEESGYEQSKTDFLIDGFKNGFSIGYQGPMNIKQTAPNLKFRGVGNKTELWNKVMKEVKLKRYAGPYENIPFDDYIQSLIGLVPKDGGKSTRLIFHLSYPRGRGLSVNQNTPQEICKVQYPEFDAAVRLCLRLGVNCRLAKSDMTSAFRNLGIKKSHWCLLIMKAESPLDGKVYYFVDKCLLFGASITCSRFQKFSDAVAHLVQFKTKEDLVNYLDDFLFAALLKAWCDSQVRTFIEICEQIRFPVSMEKTYWGTTRLVFLGLLLDTVNQVVEVPIEKIEKALNLIREVIGKRSIMLKQLQKICGFFNFLGRAVIPGRAFTRQLYMFTKGSEGKLKAHHHIKMNQEIKKDLVMWQVFLEDPTCYARPFLDFSMSFNAEEISMFSDATKNLKLGFGGLCQNSWVFGQWDEQFMLAADPSIKYLELFAVTVTILNWLHRFANSRIILFCDNQAVVAMINKNTSSCKNCLHLIRIIVLHSMRLNVRVFARYISSKNNKSADFLSRLRLQDFRILNPEADQEMMKIPEQLWPISKIWIGQSNSHQ